MIDPTVQMEVLQGRDRVRETFELNQLKSAPS